MAEINITNNNNPIAPTKFVCSPGEKRIIIIKEKLKLKKKKLTTNNDNDWAGGVAYQGLCVSAGGCVLP